MTTKDLHVCTLSSAENLVKNVIAYMEREKEETWTESDACEYIAQHCNTDEDTPSVYVGSYGAYNMGSLRGAWVDLTTFGDYEEYEEFCQAIHGLEGDCEVMLQDFQNFPEEWYDEGGLGETAFNSILAWSELDEEDKEIYEAYCKAFGKDCEVFDEDFKDGYYGHFDSYSDLAEEYVAEGCMDIPESVEPYIDWERLGRDLSYDFNEYDGYYFFNN